VSCCGKVKYPNTTCAIGDSYPEIVGWGIEVGDVSATIGELENFTVVGLYQRVACWDIGSGNLKLTGRKEKKDMKTATNTRNEDDTKDAAPYGRVQCRVVRHGLDCAKVTHVGPGHLHADDDDTAYFVDGVAYCGRCHAFIGL